MIIRTHAYPRAALIGNPSDGYFGKTIAFTFADFRAEIMLYETPELAILPSIRDGSVFASLESLAEDVRLYGHYGGIRLLKAAIKCFHDHCREEGIALHDRNFTVRYQTDIPNLVGLAGSSAIITACLRALMTFYGVDIPRPRLANLIRDVENRELGIPAGLQDRVAQVYQGLVHMDFDRDFMTRHGHGRYEPLDPALMPPLYIAYRTDLSEGSEVFHNSLRHRFDRGETEVVAAMRRWAELTDLARQALERRDHAELGRLMDANFDLRARLCRLSEGNLRLVETARSAGVSAKFTGSGGAIVGVCPDDAAFARLQAAFAGMPVKVFRPRLA
jgi:glucuronokinase